MAVRHLFLWCYVFVLLVIAMIMPPVAQSQLYHAFADQRGFLGIPNFLDVVSNLPFLLIGAAGIIFLQSEKRDGWRNDLTGIRSAYQLVFLCSM